MSATLVYYRFSAKLSEEYETVPEAARVALAILEYDNGYPTEILEGNKSVWKESSSFSTTEELEKLLKITPPRLSPEPRSDPSVPSSPQ